MRAIALILCATLLSACVSAPPTPGDLPRGAWQADNDCLVAAVSKFDALSAYGLLHGTSVPRGVLVMRFRGRSMGHACVVFEWGGERYVWDSTNGSVRTYFRWADPLGLARTVAPDAISARWLAPPADLPASR